ncbi:hypothetical protein WJX73_003333 [Symbiochloris irregularis]|uniref:F-box domain-containing protein n=1 Tax=Symbiochloris irregularis TaxID=706552 RepID=A0AAW1PZ20_9CHLO
MRTGLTLSAPAVAVAVRDVIAPLLDARDLASLARSCKAFKLLTREIAVSVWESAAKRHLPKPHPMAQPATRASIDQALQAYATARTNVRAGHLVDTKRIQASSASFNVTGSHLAVIEDRSVKVFDTATAQCVENFTGLRTQHTAVQWGQQGTVGTFSGRQKKGAVTLYHGDLVSGPQQAPAWKLLEHTPLPEARPYTKLHISPDLSKVFFSFGREVNPSDTEDEEGDLTGFQNICRVVDAHAGEILWEQALEFGNLHCMDYTCMVWHPICDTFFLALHDVDDQLYPGETFAVSIADGFQSEFNFNVRETEADYITESMSITPMGPGHEPDDVWLTLQLTSQDEANTTERALLQWPSKSIHWFADSRCLFDLWCTLPVETDFVLVIDAGQPDLPIVARLNFDEPFAVKQLEWSADSTKLCACGHPPMDGITMISRTEVAGATAFIFEFQS